MNDNLWFLIIFIISFLVGSYAGTCPRYPLIRDFNLEQYMGMWYQQDKKQSSWEVPGRCWKSFYMKDPKNGQFKLRMIFENTITRREEMYDSEISLVGPRRPSVLKYTIPFTFMEDKFQVLATDYTTFSVEYKCDPNGILEKQESVFLLTREQNPSPLILQKAYAIMHRYGIDIRKLERVDQTCGGMKLPTGGASKSPDSEDYDYISSPQQGIDNNSPFLSSEAETARFDYFDAPPIVSASSRFTERRPPVIRKRTNILTYPFPSHRQINLGASLASHMKHRLHRIRN